MMTSTSCCAPSAVAMPPALIASIGVVSTVTLSLLERGRVAAAVEHDALRDRRVARQHLRPQLGVGERDLVVHAEHRPQHLVRRAHRRAVALPVGIDRRERQQALLRAGEDPEAIPVRELRHVAQQGALRDRHVIFVAGHRQQPRRRSLEHHELGRDLGDARNELRGAGTGADHARPACRAGRRSCPTGPSGTTAP